MPCCGFQAQRVGGRAGVAGGADVAGRGAAANTTRRLAQVPPSPVQVRHVGHAQAAKNLQGRGGGGAACRCGSVRLPRSFDLMRLSSRQTPSPGDAGAHLVPNDPVADDGESKRCWDEHLIADSLVCHRDRVRGVFVPRSGSTALPARKNYLSQRPGGVRQLPGPDVCGARVRRADATFCSGRAAIARATRLPLPEERGNSSLAQRLPPPPANAAVRPYRA